MNEINHAQQMIDFTQRIADLLYQAACSESAEVSWGQGPFYRGLDDTLRATIKATYPDVDTDRVRELIIDNGESVQSNVDYWRAADKRHEWCLAETTGDGKGYCHDHQVTYSY